MLSRHVLGGAMLALAAACSATSATPPRQSATTTTSDVLRSEPVVVEPPTEPRAEVEGPVQPGAPQLAGAGDWAVFHGGPERHGVSTAAPLLAPVLSWKARVGIQGWLNSPLVVGKTVLVPSSGTTHNAPDSEDGFYALDLASGTRLWFAPLAADANGAAADKRRAYVACDDGQLHALELESGKRAWSAPAKGKVYGHPLLVGELVVVTDAAGYVRAFDRHTGAARWAVQLSGPIRGGASSDGRTIYAASQGGELAALTPEGKVRYRRTLKRPPWDGRGPEEPIEVYSPPIVGDSELFLPYARDTYYSDRPALMAVSKKLGIAKWRARGAGEWGNIRSTPALVGDLLIYGEPYSGDVAAVSASSGRVAYRKTVGACYFPHWSSAAAAGDVVYLMRFDGVLHALRAGDGQPMWRFYLGEAGRAGSDIPPELEAGGDRCEWQVALGNPAYSPVAVASDGTVLVGTHEGYVFALGPQ